MDPVVARKMWRTLEPLHGIVYFAADAGARYRALGLPEHMHYFPTRAAAMGPVPAEVVMATFFNFHPAVVRAAIPAAWEIAAPEQILAARVAGAGDVLRRILGDAVDSPEVAEAARLARPRGSAAGRRPRAPRPRRAPHRRAGAGAVAGDRRGRLRPASRARVPPQQGDRRQRRARLPPLTLRTPQPFWVDIRLP